MEEHLKGMTWEELLRVRGVDANQAMEEMLEKQDGTEGIGWRGASSRDFKLKQEMAGQSVDTRKRRQLSRMLKNTTMYY